MSEPVAQDRFAASRDVISAGLAQRAFPAAAVSVGRSSGAVWEEAFGRLTFDEAARPTELSTFFDLASLTKVIATASIAMRQVETGLIRLDLPVANVMPAWRDRSAEPVRVRHLLDHSSGLPAHVRLWERAAGREAYELAICSTPLEREPGTTAVYSDLGFILLGLTLERTAGRTLDVQLANVLGPLTAELFYRPLPALRPRIAPTEHDPWRGRLLQGEVHDENAAALGGVASHAGLFGTAGAVGKFARLVLRTFREQTALGSPETMRLFASKTGVRGSSRALAWDTALPTSSCGARMSAAAIGHTGFTGTSLWIDPGRDVYAVLLTNRVHPTRRNERLLPLRARFHDALPF